MSRLRDNLVTLEIFGYCVCQLPVKQYLGQPTYREERFILAHQLRDFIPRSVAPLSSACGEAEHHVWECKMEEAAYLMVTRKHRELGRSPSPSI